MDIDITSLIIYLVFIVSILISISIVTYYDKKILSNHVEHTEEKPLDKQEDAEVLTPETIKGINGL